MTWPARRWAVLVLALLAGAAAPGLVPAATTPYRVQGTDGATVTFVLGNLEFVLLHELAHVVMGELDVPVLGPEEDTADYLAATAFLSATRDDPAQYRRATAYLLAAADGLNRAWAAGQARGGELPYWNSHSLNVQRFYTLVCLVYGSNPVDFDGLPRQAGLPPARAAGCAAEWQKADRSYRWLLDNYGRKPGSPPGPAIAVLYDPPGTLVSAELLRQVQADGLLERVAAAARERVVLPRPLALRMTTCGRAEAAWQPERRELVLCYELLEALYGLAGQGPPKGIRP